ncbi:hypothetical protein KVR01_004947 [Diaporthe batatas]|uniref:uncharacterized protein n=1 Tax=Diaporthe batatas TaxID=748121 RepID=UPI001D04C818|nr:uncharacterized protein KVR01_004947 [Diaporthe batatas]KAG8164672.1 hypothetical protein KVR01_004947 [Diaporthe batatas]
MTHEGCDQPAVGCRASRAMMSDEGARASLGFEFKPKLLARSDGPWTAWNSSALTEIRLPRRLGVKVGTKVGTGLPRTLDCSHRTGPGPEEAAGWRTAEGLAVPIRQTAGEREGFSSRMEAGGWTARQAGGWPAGGSQIMPRWTRDEAC